MSNTIRIISTSDVHGKVLPHSYADGRELNCGFVKLAALVDELRTENTILIDNGDTLDGSPLQSFYYAQQRSMKNDGHDAEKDGSGRSSAMESDFDESPVSKAMALMKYDYINVGNHDFDYGSEELRKHIEKTGAKCINLNLGFDYDVREIAGYRIAFFGVLTHFTTRWESEEKLAGAEFPDAFLLAKETVERIKDEVSPDYIVCCYHGGLERSPETGEVAACEDGENQGYRMLTEIDGIDVLIMGHQHTLSAGVYFSGDVNTAEVGEAQGRYPGRRTAYLQPGVDGSYVSVIDLEAGTGKMEARLVPLDISFSGGVEASKSSVDAVMHTVSKASVDAVIPTVSRAIVDAVMPMEEACQRWLDMPIGRSKIDLLVHDEERERLDKPQFITFINKVQMERMDADIAASSLFKGATGLGPVITMRDLVSSYAFPNTLVKKRITGRVLKEYIEKTLEFWQATDGKIEVSLEYLKPIEQHFNYDIFDGIEYEAEISRPRGGRLTKLTRGGRSINDDDEFTIVLNNYRASGGGNYPMLAKLETIGEDLTNMVDVLAEYIRGCGEIDFEPVYNVRIRV